MDLLRCEHWDFAALLVLTPDLPITWHADGMTPASPFMSSIVINRVQVTSIRMQSVTRTTQYAHV